MVSAAGRAQALAFEVGEGRVVIQGEAAMLSAQVAGWKSSRWGMNFEGFDNKQYALSLTPGWVCVEKIDFFADSNCPF